MQTNTLDLPRAGAAQTDAAPFDEGDSQVVDLLQRKVVVQRQLLTLAKDHGIAAYRPHWYQHVYHSATQKRRGLFAGNRFGKSQCNGAETAAWMMGERTWYRVAFNILGVEHTDGVGRRVVVKEVHPGGNNHPLVHQGIPPFPTKQLIVCTNWDMVHKIWTSRDSDRPGKIWQFLPKGWATWSTNHEGVISEVYGKNGSYLCFMSADAYKRNKLIAESTDWDRVAFDEPAPEGLWVGSSRGLTDRRGQGDFTLTGMQEMWIYDRFQGDGSQDSPSFPTADRFSLRTTMFDNPHLSDEAIKLFMSDLTSDEIQCRIFGHPLELSGLIYKEFNRVDHVLTSLLPDWKDWHLPPRSFILYARADTHPVKPHAVSFFAVGPNEVPVQCHEIWEATDADSLAKTIAAYVASTGCFFGGFKVEPAAWIKDSSTRTVSIAQTLARHGLFPRPASKDLSNGILLVKSALKQKSVLFTPTCRRTLWEFGRYRYNPETGKPVDENDHFMENLYRLVIDRPRFFNPDGANYPVEDEAFVTADLSTDY